MKKILSKGHTRGSRWIALPVLALAVLLSIVVAWCMEPPAENAELMYVFVDNDDQVHIIDREHQIAYETESLQFHTDTSAADLQILLRKKENVTITKDGETFTAAARRETVENLLRRMDLEPDAGEMVALSVQDDGVHVDIVRDFYHDWNTEAVVPYETGAPREPPAGQGIRAGRAGGQRRRGNGDIPRHLRKRRHRLDRSGRHDGRGPRHRDRGIRHDGDIRLPR